MSPVSPARLSRVTPRTLLLVALLVPLHLPLAAQVNIESLRREDPPDGVSGSLGGDLSVNTGNVDFYLLMIHIYDQSQRQLLGLKSFLYQ